MLRESESVAAESDGLPPLGTRSDRQAAHYYRSMHGRAVQREQRWKEKALAAEQIIKHLLVLLGYCVQKIGSAHPASGLAQQAAVWQQIRIHSGRAGGRHPTCQPGRKRGHRARHRLQGKRKRGQQPGAKGPKRRLRLNLPVERSSIIGSVRRSAPARFATRFVPKSA